MTVSFSLTPHDFALLRKVVARRLQRRQGALSIAFAIRVAAGMCIGCGMALLARAVTAAPFLSALIWLGGGLLVAAVLPAVAAPDVAVWSTRHVLVSPRGAFLSPQTVSLSADGLGVTSAVAQSQVAWSGILSREDDEKNIYLFVDELQALVLPRTVLAGMMVALDERTAHLKA